MFFCCLMRDILHFRVLSGMRMLSAGKNLQTCNSLPAHVITGKQSLNRLCDHAIRMAFAHSRHCCGFMAAPETGVALIDLFVILGAGELHVLGINHDDKVTGIDVIREDRLVAAAQQIGDLDG